MKKIILFLVGILMTSLTFVFADQGGYTISNYTVDMQLHTNGSMHVIENITANFSEARHGIYREIPVNSNGRNISIANLTTTTDPIADNSIINGNYTLKIGDANQTIIGNHNYIITYDVLNPITSFNNSGATSQELYRNVIGNERNTSIQNISFSITIPSSKQFTTKEMFVVYGPNGAQDTTGAIIEQKTSTKVNGSLNNITLNPQEGATVGLQFRSGYFTLPTGYENLGDNIQQTAGTSGASSSVSNGGNNRFDDAFGFIWFLIVIVGGIFGKKGIGGNKSARKSNKAVTIYYTPPKNIEASEAFRFRYNKENPKIFSALIYYRATKGRIKIEDQTKRIFSIITTGSYHLIETGLRPVGATAFDDVLFQKFFGTYDNKIDNIELDETAYKKVKKIFSALNNKIDTSGLTESSGLFGLSTKLTPQGEILFEQLRGYKEFLEKVERPVIESELKNDPDYINKILPRAVLFGLETKLLTRIEDLLQESAKDRYYGSNGALLNVTSLMLMSSAIRTNSINHESSSSGFGGGGGFSGGGGGGGGGGSR